MGILESEIQENVRNLSNEKLEIQDSIALVDKRIKEISIVIEALRESYRTTGGSKMIEKLSKIEFDVDGLQQFGQEIENISCDYKRVSKG